MSHGANNRGGGVVYQNCRLPFLTISIYSSCPISGMSINRCENPINSSGTKTCAQWRFFPEIKVPIPCNHVYFCSVLKTTLEHPIAYALYHITIRDSGLFFPKLMWQFRLLIFSFSKSLDGCAMTWVSQPALSCDQLALWVFLVDELFPPLSCTHPIHQRLQCVLERIFCKERWMINWEHRKWLKQIKTEWLGYLTRTAFACLNTNHTASSMNANLQVDTNF